MKHTKEKTLSGILRLFLLLAVPTCLLIAQGCGQSRTLTKQNNEAVKKASSKAALEKVPEIKPPLTAAPVTAADVMPVFPGGDDGLLRFISSNLTYPTSAQEQKIEGRVGLRFIIDTDGWAKNIEVIRSIHPTVDEAAIMTIKRMPKWTPGRKNGVAVPVYFNLPIMFKLNNK